MTFDLALFGLGISLAAVVAGVYTDPYRFGAPLLRDDGALAAILHPLVLLAPVWVYTIWLDGHYERLLRGCVRTGLGAGRPLLIGTGAVGLGLWATGTATGAPLFGFLLASLASGIVCHLLLGRILRGALLRVLRGRGLTDQVLVITGVDGGARAAAVLSRHAALVRPAVLFAAGDPSPDTLPFTDVPRAEAAAAILPLALQHHVNRCLLPEQNAAWPEREQIIALCRDFGIDCWQLREPRAGTESDAALIVDLGGGRRSAPAPVIKEIADVCLGAALLLFTLPLLALIAVAVKLGSRGPVLFRQTRDGLHGRPFTILKFRTMRPDSKAPESPAFAAPDILVKPRLDPRVTRIGYLLRRSSLDELPQLWNVLKGEMSLVGPRPLRAVETSAIGLPDGRRRLAMKPGMTGLWQVSGRSAIRSPSKRVELDISYVDEWSLTLDLRILARTVAAVLTARGAQ